MNDPEIRELMSKIAVSAKASGINYVTVMLGEKGPIVGTNIPPADAALILAECAGSIIVGAASLERCQINIDEAFDQAPPSRS